MRAEKVKNVRTVKSRTTVFLSAVLTLSLLPSSAFAEGLPHNFVDLYGANSCETVVIEGVTYQFIFSYDVAGNRTISITNTVDGAVDVVVCDESSATLFVNGEPVGTFIYLVGDSRSATVTQALRAGYVYLYPFSTFISWSGGVAVAVLAAMIAAAAPVLGPAGVLAAMGSAALTVLASMAAGATVSGDLYQFQPASPPYHYQLQWKLKVSEGSTYGIFTSYFTV
jgi:hypothetical protein